MVEWLAGNRIRGTSAEKPALALQSPSVGGWKEVGRTTLGSAGDTISVSSLADKRYYMVLCDIQQVTSNIRSATRLNADTGSNYATRDSEGGGADSTATSGSYIKNSGSLTKPMFNVQYLSNLSTKEKLMLSHNVGQGTAGASTAPDRMESVGKWANTSNPISTIAQYNDQGGSYNTNSEVVVLGWDPADTHTTNFWEELASVDLSGGASTNLSSGTILAKKYLWVQMLMEQTVDSNYQLRFNADSGSNYAYRYKTDGGTEFTHASQTGMNLRSSTANLPVFVNMFIVNNSANEKLIIEHDIKSNTAGAGNAPLRTEQVGKWANTSAQITSVQLHSGSGNLNTNTLMKVWGSN
jgi:hypothetical protein